MRKLAAVPRSPSRCSPHRQRASEHDCCCDTHDYGAHYAHDFGSDYGRGGFGRPEVRGYEAIGPGYRRPSPGIVAASRASLAAVGVYAHE